MSEIEKVQQQLLEKRRRVIRLNHECILAEEWLAQQRAMLLRRTTPRNLYQQGYKHGITHNKPDSNNRDYLRGFKVARKSHQ